MRELISPWGPYLKDFYEYKQLCGFKYTKNETPLFLFDRYYASLGIKELKLSREIIEPFLYLKPDERITNQVNRASVLRQFIKYVMDRDIIESAYLIPQISIKGESEYIPYIFSAEELHLIVNYLDNYYAEVPPGGFELYPNTLNAISTAFKILMSTGMRLGEVLNLKLKDVDMENHYLVLKQTKNHNERIVPISSTIRNEIAVYIEKTPFHIDNSDFLFQTKKGTQLKRYACTTYFYKSLRKAGIEHIKGKGPRIHDFRHTFAVMSLTQLQRNEKDVNLSLSYLSSYLGHKSIKETQKYIWMTPELFSETNEKMINYSSFLKKIFDGEKYDED